MVSIRGQHWHLWVNVTQPNSNKYELNTILSNSKMCLGKKNMALARKCEGVVNSDK